MYSYPVSAHENERLQALFSYHILDSYFEKEFDDLVQLAARVLHAPVAAIVFIDNARQWVKAQKGLHFCELGRDISVCKYTIMQDDLLEIEDLQQDERFRHFPYVVNDPSYRYYAGVPLITKKGFKIGVFYIIDTVARKLSDEGDYALTMLARQAMKQVELRLQNVHLEKQNQQQRHITSMLSHDIKNPLSNIKMALSMQQSGNDLMTKAEADHMNDVLSKQVDSAISMVNNITKWGRLQIQGCKEQLQYTNLRQLVNEVMEEIDSASKCNIIINALPELANVFIDREGVCFALRNLLTNANKFTSQGCIVVSHENKDGKDYLHVTDTGIGMSREQTDKLNCNKVVNSCYGTNNEKGSGLGLGLVHDYIAGRGGQLFFQSEVGKGTKVSFTI